MRDENSDEVDTADGIQPWETMLLLVSQQQALIADSPQFVLAIIDHMTWSVVQ